jgi:DNA primase
MPNDWVDFKDIKNRVPIEEVLSLYGIQLRKVGSSDLRGRCPLPTHTSRSSTDSFSVSLTRNVWSCQSVSCVAARSGRIGGNLLDLVALMEGCPVREAALRLRHMLMSPSATLQPERAESLPPRQTHNRPLAFTLQNVDYGHAYLQERGTEPETAKRFGIGMYGGEGFLHGRIAIPIHNEHGQLIAYAGRTVGHDDPKYRFPAGFKKSEVLFNLHRALQGGRREVIIVEGFFDAVRVHQAGYPAVVALMGASLSDSQADLLTKYFSRTLIMLDGDAAGKQGTAAIIQKLKSRVPVLALHVADGTQPDQMRAEEITSIVRGHQHGFNISQ